MDNEKLTLHLKINHPQKIGEKEECVILLHGLARSHRSMGIMAKNFQQNGYATIKVSYPSTRLPVAQCSVYLKDAINLAQRQNFSHIHFVTHSLGGIILRHTLSSGLERNAGRAVMISPPNHGSEIVDRIGSWKLFQWVNGPAGQQLSTASGSLPNRLGPATIPTGVITGDRCAFFDLLFRTFFTGRNDGKVSVESARLEEMRDFIVVHQSHPFIMNAEEVLKQSLYFIQHGQFQHNGSQ